MDDNKYIIKTGFYSDYACEFFNCLKRQTVSSFQSVNSAISSLFSNVDVSDVSMPKFQTYEFKHLPTGEVALKSVIKTDGHYYNEDLFKYYSNACHLKNIALQIKLLVQVFSSENTWRRDNFSDAVSFYSKDFPIAELYFIYDVLLNHVRSVKAFKQQYPAIAAKIIGIPNDPITAEIKQNLEDKCYEISAKYQVEIDDATIGVFAYNYSKAKASQDLRLKLEAIIEEARKESAKKINEIEAMRDAEIKALTTSVNEVFKYQNS